MKKAICVCSALILILSCGFTLGSCGRGENADTTYNSADESLATAVTAANEEDSSTEILAESWYDRQPTAVDKATTNEGYSAEYEMLTLPPAANEATGAVAGETASVPGTTANAEENTTKAVEPTQQTTAQKPQGTTAAQAPNWNGGEVATFNPVERPGVTYFDKYVKSVLNSGNYTATVSGKFSGYSATVKIYKNGGKEAYEVSTVYHSVPVSFRYFYSGGNVYLIVPAMASYAKVDVADPIVGTLEAMVAAESVAMTADGMDYCGVTNTGGYVRETYKAADGTIYHYFFSSSGLERIDVVSGGSGSTIKVHLASGAASWAFSVPSGYVKVDVQVFIDKYQAM